MYSVLEGFSCTSAYELSPEHLLEGGLEADSTLAVSHQRMMDGIIKFDETYG
jgi:hypothetical protein